MNVTKQLYQWDTGQKLTECTGIYVDYLIGDEVYRVEITDGICIIPDELLQTSGGHNVYECMTNNTIQSFAFKVLPRPIPPNYVFTPTERLTFEGLVQKVDDAVADMIRRAESGEFDGHTPVKGTDYFTASEIQQIQNEVSSGAIGEFKTVVDTETETFNANATEKVNAYNQNDSEKTASYNANATEKLNAYNSNAESKVTEYNQNDTNKTAEYNSNADNRLAEYNQNADNRLAEFDAHTEQIQSQIDSKADKTELAITNSYLDALFKLNKGQTYDVLEQESEAYSVDVPSGAKYVGIDKVGGKSVVWNQQVIPEKRNNAITPDGSVTYSTIGMSFSSVINHVYLCSADIVYNGDKNPLRAYCSLGSGNYGFPVIDITHTGTTHCEWLAKRISSVSQTQFGLSNITTSEKLTSEDAWECNNSMMIDITQMFGSTIADYIYSLEQATAGAGVAWFRRLFPDDYYPYCEPTIISSQTDRVDVASADSTVTQQITTGFPALNSAGSVYDYIDLNEGKLHQRVGVVDLGSLSWGYHKETSTFNAYFQATINGIKRPNWNVLPNWLLNTKYDVSSADDLLYLNKGKDKTISVHATADYIIVRDSAYSNATAFRQALQGVMLYYELAEEIITDIEIPTELSDWLKVEAGGSVTFHNTDEGKRLLIPNKLSFIRKLDEVSV